MANPTIKNIQAYADGFGLWRAEVLFDNPPTKDVLFALRDKETIDQYMFIKHHLWSKMRRLARKEIIKALTEREQKIGESKADTEKRVRSTLGNLIISENIIHDGKWIGIIFSEPDKTYS